MSNTKPALTLVEHRGRSFYFVFPTEDDHIYKTIRETGHFYESALLEGLAGMLHPGDHVLDVGANVGTHSVYFAGVLGCRVTAFEPVPATVRMLQENLRINGLAELVEVRVEAVGAHAGRAVIQSEDATNSGATRLAVADEGPIAAVSLDALLPTLAPVRALKIDVEGMEAEVIAGAQRLIARDRPVVACESLDAAHFERLSAQMQALGYVACNVFNASPTFVFLPVAELTQRADLLGFVAGSVLKVRQDASKALRLVRGAQRVAEDAQREVAELRDLRPKVDELEPRLRQLQAGVEARLLQLDASLQAALAELQKKVDPSAMSMADGTSVQAAIEGVRASNLVLQGSLDVVHAELKALGLAGEATRRTLAELEAVRQSLAQLAAAQADADTGRAEDRAALDQALGQVRDEAREQGQALTRRVDELRVGGDGLQARFLALSDDVIRSSRANNFSVQTLAESVESLRVEHTLLARDMQRRMTRAERRFDKLLNGRVFGTLRRLKLLLQRLGLMKDTKTAAPVEPPRPAVPAPAPVAPAPKAAAPAATVPVPAPAPSPLPAAAPAAAAPVAPAALAAPAAPAAASTVAAEPAPQPAPDAAPAPAAASLPRPEKVRLAGVPYMSRPLGGVTGHQQVYTGMPLISVVMTSYNTGELIEPAVQSILAQTWTNLELIVVDDCSTDDTRAIVERLAAADPRVKLFCFGDNRGTYWCKNFGITQSSGVAVTFMDSDDTSHPTRVELQFEALNRPGYAVSTCNHIRVDTDGKTISINGVTERIAYISQMFKRSVIQEVGYFDTIRTSADDEILRRIKATYGPESHTNVKRVLYTALLRDGSLTRDPENAINFVQPRGENQSFLSPQRRHYAAMVTRWHEFLAQKNLRPYMPFPVVRRPFPVFGKLIVAPGRYDHNMISACIASYPPRQDKLKAVVATLLPQVDQLFVYLNEYEEVPDFLRHSRISVELGGKERNLRDNGKFYFAAKVPAGYVLTVDDDIVYPPDYVEAMVRKIEFYERRAVVGVHGTIFDKPIRNYFRGRTLYHFELPMEHDVVVNQLGTGTVAFHTELLRPDFDTFKTTGMADVWLALQCKAAQAPMIAIAREAGWLQPMGVEEKTLFREFRKDDSRQTKLVKSVAPWHEDIVADLGAIVSTRRRAYGEAYARLLPRPAPAPVAERSDA